MDNNNRDRSELFAEYVIDNRATVRSCAAHFNISKSTVHKDLSHRLRYINRNLYSQAKEILDLNKAQRHIRGGEATRLKYSRRKAGKTTLPDR